MRFSVSLFFSFDRWLSLSQKKEIPYTLLILMNMLHFEHVRTELKIAAKAEQAQQARQAQQHVDANLEILPDADIDVLAAQAALSSLDTSIASKSTLVSQVRCHDLVVAVALAVASMRFG